MEKNYPWLLFHLFAVGKVEQAIYQVTLILGMRLFADTETRKNFPEQIVAGKFTGNCRQVLLGLA